MTLCMYTTLYVCLWQQLPTLFHLGWENLFNGSQRAIFNRENSFISVFLLIEEMRVFKKEKTKSKGI